MNEGLSMNSYPLDSQNTRLHTELTQIEEDESMLPYRISQRPDRTLIIFNVPLPSNQQQTSLLVYPQQQDHPSNISSFVDLDDKYIDFEPIKSSRPSSKRYLQESSQDIVMLQSPGHMNRGEQTTNNKSIIMVLIAYHKTYPFEPPLLVLGSSGSIFPPLNTFKDYLYDAMELEQWWPLITLPDIIEKLPALANKLTTMSNNNSGTHTLGSYAFQYPIYLADASQFGNGVSIVRAKIKYPNKGVISFLSDPCVGISMTHLLILKSSEYVAKLRDKQFEHSIGQETFVDYIIQGKKLCSYQFPYQTTDKQIIQKIRICMCYFQIAVVSNREQEAADRDQVQKIYMLMGDRARQINDQQLEEWARIQAKRTRFRLSSK